MANNTAATYVRTDTGIILVQLPADNQWGFELCDDDQVWPGGVGVAESWEAISVDAVSAEDRERLGWLLEL